MPLIGAAMGMQVIGEFGQRTAQPAERTHIIAVIALKMVGPGKGARFGFLALFASLDNPTSNALTRRVLDWNPERPGLIGPRPGPLIRRVMPV